MGEICKFAVLLNTFLDALIQFCQDDRWNNAELNEKWTLLLNLKGEINQVLESARQDK
jgi:hypothetical protein